LGFIDLLELSNYVLTSLNTFNEININIIFPFMFCIVMKHHLGIPVRIIHKYHKYYNKSINLALYYVVEILIFSSPSPNGIKT